MSQLDSKRVTVFLPKNIVTLKNGQMRSSQFTSNLEEVVEDLYKRIEQLENTIYDLILLGELDETKLKESKKVRD